MRAASRVFFLAVFSLLAPSHASSGEKSPSATRSLSSNPNVCAFEPSATVSDACASYNTLDDINEAIHPHLETLTRNTDFFSYYRLNLFNKACPFWDDNNGLCGNIACAVNTLENEKDIPEVWRAHELGKLRGPRAPHPDKRMQAMRRAAGGSELSGELGVEVAESCVVEPELEDCDDRDYCVLEDEADLSSGGDYVSLVENPERFTGYAGPSSQQVWEAIYRENCFSKVDDSEGSNGVSQSSPLVGGFGGLAAQRDLLTMQQKQGIQAAISSGSTPQPRDALIHFDDTCLEKRVFHRVVSGMHASISTHLCWEYLNQTTGEWSPNLECFEKRLHNHPERLSNLYFNYALFLRAVRKARTHIATYSFCSTDPEQDIRTKKLVLDLAKTLPEGTQIFDESAMFQSADYDPARGVSLKEDFRGRFRNISRIMDCVGCDKCRLWGKLQTQGYGTALKVLFEFDENDSSRDPPLRRTELVALVNTLNRLSHSLAAVKNFEAMIESREALKTKHGATASVAIPKPQRSAVRDPFKMPKESTQAIFVDPETDALPDFLMEKNRPNYAQMTLMESVKYEMWLVWMTSKFVVRQWFVIPGRLTRIATLEAGRLWDYWVGRPVGGPSFRWRSVARPGSEEL